MYLLIAFQVFLVAFCGFGAIASEGSDQMLYGFLAAFNSLFLGINVANLRG